MINTIICDMDGVIVDSVGLHYKIWEEVAQKFGFEMSHELFDEMNGMDTPKMSELIVNKFNLGVSPETISQGKKTIATQRLQNGVEMFPGVKTTLGNLKKQGYRIGLATMSPREQVETALGTNILELEFDKIVTDEDVENPKPAPDIFLKCAEKLGKDPEQCVVIEDAINGIIAAKSANMKAIAVTTTTAKDKFTQADAIVSSIKDVTSDLIYALESKIEILEGKNE